MEDGGFYRANVLMVSEEAGDLLHDHMESNGFRFANLHAADVAPVLEELSRRHYDLLVLANRGTAPEELGGQIGAILAAFPNLRILAASPETGDGPRSRWAASGADGFLPIPFEPLELIELVNATVRPRQ